MTAPDVPVGIVTGLASEQACLSRGNGVRVVCAGASSVRARALAEELAEAGCTALISFGLAGGLDPALESGTLLLPRVVLTPDGRRYSTDAAWRQRLVEAIGDRLPRCAGAVAGVDAPLAASADKASLYEATGAAAVDMESHAVAEVAARRALPVLVVRAVADPAGESIPRWLDGVVAPDGRPRLGAVLAGVGGHPGDLTTLVRLALASRRAMTSLRRVAALVGSRFLYLP